VRQRTDDPVVLLSVLLESRKDEMKSFVLHRTWKWSNREDRLAQFLCRFSPPPIPIDFQRLFTSEGVPHDHLSALAAYLDVDLPPLQMFPVTGHHLLGELKQGRNIGWKLQHLKVRWLDSGCTLSLKQLME